MKYLWKWTTVSNKIDLWQRTHAAVINDVNRRWQNTGEKPVDVKLFRRLLSDSELLVSLHAAVNINSVHGWPWRGVLDGVDDQENPVFVSPSVTNPVPSNCCQQKPTWRWKQTYCETLSAEQASSLSSFFKWAQRKNDDSFSSVVQLLTRSHWQSFILVQTTG